MNQMTHSLTMMTETFGMTESDLDEMKEIVTGTDWWGGGGVATQPSFGTPYSTTRNPAPCTLRPDPFTPNPKP